MAVSRRRSEGVSAAIADLPGHARPGRRKLIRPIDAAGGGWSLDGRSRESTWRYRHGSDTRSASRTAMRRVPGQGRASPRHTTTASGDAAPTRTASVTSLLLHPGAGVIATGSRPCSGDRIGTSGCELVEGDPAPNGSPYASHCGVSTGGNKGIRPACCARQACPAPRANASISDFRAFSATAPCARSPGPRTMVGDDEPRDRRPAGRSSTRARLDVPADLVASLVRYHADRLPPRTITTSSATRLPRHQGRPPPPRAEQATPARHRPSRSQVARPRESGDPWSCGLRRALRLAPEQPAGGGDSQSRDGVAGTVFGACA